MGPPHRIAQLPLKGPIPGDPWAPFTAPEKT